MKKQILSFPVVFTILVCGLMAGLFLTGGSAEDLSVPDFVPEISAAEPVYPININTATEAELSFLPGIGPAIAGRIAAYRLAHGAFSAPQELEQVSGIGPELLNELLPYITTGG